MRDVFICAGHGGRSGHEPFPVSQSVSQAGAKPNSDVPFGRFVRNDLYTTPVPGSSQYCHKPPGFDPLCTNHSSIKQPRMNGKYAQADDAPDVKNPPHTWLAHTPGNVDAGYASG